MKSIFLLVLTISFYPIKSQTIIFFEDNALKEKLLEATQENKIAKNKDGEKIKIDADNDGEIDTNEALSVVSLNLYPGDISKLGGIEKFENLKNLDLATNNLTKFENINLPNLETLDLLDNDIISLKIDNLKNLRTIICQQNKLKKLSIIGLENLESIFCNINPIRKTVLKNLPKLTHIGIDN